MSVLAAAQPHAFLAMARDAFALLKPRVMSLVVFTGAVGLVAAPGTLGFWHASALVALIALAAGGAGALNMWYEADLDALMARTRRRPLPDGRLPRSFALVFGLVCVIGAVGGMAAIANPLAAGLTLLTAVHYVLVYTMWLKPRTPQNIVIGGAAGALPPAIGWAAATGTLALEPILLFLVIFLWTPPHFWALALWRDSDYAAAGLPMLPNVVGRRPAARHALVYAVLTAIAAPAPWVLGLTGPVYGVAALGLSVAFVVFAARVAFAPDDVVMASRAKRLFALSIFYLFIVFLARLLDAWVYPA